jgi:iron complex transport system substrate-binding protein
MKIPLPNQSRFRKKIVTNVCRLGVLLTSIVGTILAVDSSTRAHVSIGTIGEGRIDDPAIGPPGTGSRPVEVVEQCRDYRVIRHAAGTTRVPANPRRICALSAADELLSIGIKPVAHSINDGNFPDYLAQPLADVPWIPNVYGAQMPNLEAVVGVKPDLIITRNTSRQTYQQLSRIAPVVVLLDHLQFYRQRLLDVGVIVGKESEAKAILAWYNEKVNAANAVLHPIVGEQTMAMMAVRPRVYRLFGDQQHVSPLLYGDLRMNKPELVHHRTWSSTMSPEQLLHFEADYLILAVDQAAEGNRTYDNLRDSFVWQRVPAVRNGNMLAISRYRHWSDSGILGRSRSIDDVLRLVAPHAIDKVRARAEEAYRESQP